MKVVCDNCRAVYKVPDDKLTKPVNKATCRNCGHRMLIPHAQGEVDADEQTVVASVPPTPNPGAPRAIAPRRALPVSPPRASVEPVRTNPPSPRSGQDDVRLSTPMPPDRAEAAPAVPPRPSLEPPRARPVPAPSMPEPAPLQRTPSTVVSRVATPNPAGYGPGARRTPPPPGSTPPPPPRESRPTALSAQARATPAGAQRRTPTPLSARLHDPRTDLSVAGVGTGIALVGSMVLAFLFVFDDPALLWAGLALSLGGGALTLFVLWTGDRGRKPARLLVAALLGLAVAIAVPSILVGVTWFVDQARAAYALNFPGSGDGTTSAALTAPATPPRSADGLGAEPAEPEPAAEPEGEPAPAEEEEEEEEAPTAAQPATTPKPAPSPRPSSTRPAPPRPKAASVAATAPVLPSVEGDAAPLTSVPIEAVYVMLSSNVEVKRCFVPLLQAGNLPPRVDVKFDMLGSGKATGVRVVQAEMRGSTLESCLARTISGITFPSFSGPATSITYPFILE